MFSVREMPWHGKGAVLDEYPASIDEALEKSGLGWEVQTRPLFLGEYRETVGGPNDGGQVARVASGGIEVPGHFANVRSDNGGVLGIVSDEYEIVQNAEAFKFLDGLINSDLHFETAGSIRGGKRTWVLVRLPEWTEVGGDPVGNYVFVANSHDGSMSVTSAVTPVRIVCGNTLGMALGRAKGSDRTYKFRHTGDLAVKFDEAREVMGLTINYAEQFKVMGDQLAQTKFGVKKMENVAKKLTGLDEPELSDRAKTFRSEAAEKIVEIFKGNGPDGDTTGNSPGTAWTAVNAIGEYSDWGRRVTKNTDQIGRSFEDTDLKQRGLDLVLAGVK